MVSQYADLSAYEKSWDDFQKDEEKMKRMKEKMANYTEMYLTGSREIYKVW